MRHCIYALGMVFLLLFGFSAEAGGGCNCPKKAKYVERYAVLYVASEPPGAEVISTDDGLTLSDATGTPATIVYIKSKFPYLNQMIGVLVYKDCFRPTFDRIAINRWYRTEEEAKENPHIFRPSLFPLKSCSTT